MNIYKKFIPLCFFILVSADNTATAAGPSTPPQAVKCITVEIRNFSLSELQTSANLCHRNNPETISIDPQRSRIIQVESPSELNISINNNNNYSFEMEGEDVAIGCSGGQINRRRGLNPSPVECKVINSNDI